MYAANIHLDFPYEWMENTERNLITSVFGSTFGAGGGRGGGMGAPRIDWCMILSEYI